MIIWNITVKRGLVKHLYETGVKHVQPLMQLLGIFLSVAWCFYLIRYTFFMIRNF